jgi:hypothetical protein
MAENIPLPQEQIDFQNSTSQWEATNVALATRREALLEHLRKVRSGGMQGGNAQQNMADALAELAKVDDEMKLHARTKQGAAGRPDPTTTARANSGATYNPDPRAVHAAKMQGEYGMDKDNLAGALAFLRRATPFLGKPGDFRNSVLSQGNYFDDSTLEAILDPATFSDRVSGKAQLSAGSLSNPGDSDARIGLKANQNMEPDLNAQIAGERAGLRKYNRDLAYANAGELAAKGLKGAVGTAGFGLGSVGLSSAAAGLTGDPTNDFIGRAAISMFPNSPTLQSLLSTDALLAHEEDLSNKKKFDARVFKGIYGYDRKTAGARNDIDGDVGPTIQANRSALKRSIMAMLEAKAMGFEGASANDQLMKDVDAGFIELDDLISAAALHGKSGPIPKSMQEKIKSNRAWQYSTRVNPKGMIYSLDSTGGPGTGKKRRDIYALGMDDDGKNMVFGRQSDSRDNLFEDVPLEGVYRGGRKPPQDPSLAPGGGE